MTTDMAEGTDWKPRSEPESHRWSPLGAAKRLSDRTPLRTKLITSVLVLVIMALAAISVASVAMLRSYVTTRQDSSLEQAFSYYLNKPTEPGDGTSPNLPVFGRPGNQSYILPGYAYSSTSNLIWALQKPGSQVSWVSNLVPGNGGKSNLAQGSLPQLPTSANWASSSTGVLLTVPAQSGPDTWRIFAQTQSYPITSGHESFTLVAAVDLGNINAMTSRLVLFDLIVGGVIVMVLATVAIGVVRANLRPLNDIELTAGQIAAGHLDHRVPEGDPRTEIGSLGRSLNAMLAQIERAFHAQGEAEQAAHQSEERMRRFVADAAHELRTPLTTIRGFAAHYRLRGGSGRLRPGAPGPQAGTSAVDDAYVVVGDNPVLETAADSTGPVNDAASGGVAPEGLSPDELDRLMGRVESEATRMGVLVEDLLTLARLDQQRPLNRTPVDLLTLAADAVQDARVVQPGRPIDLIVAPGTAFLIDGDEPRLRQVLANLVNNAITHTPAGTPIRVKIGRGNLEARSTANGPAGPGTAKGATGQTQAPRPAVTAVLDLWADGTDTADARERVVPAVVVDVEDDGPGMSVEQAQRVFERFYRADAARNRASGGTGLGLAIVAGLVSAHGGTVSVRTAPGKGADFQVKLPLSPDALATDDPDAEDDLLA
jgi:two-component system OmpR family sensor kinase